MNKHDKLIKISNMGKLNDKINYNIKPDKLGKDVLLKILSYCDIKTIMKIYCANSNCCRYINNDNVWLPLCKKHYNDYYKSFPKDSFKETYILCYKLAKVRKNMKFTDYSSLTKMKDLKMIYDMTSVHHSCYTIQSLPKEIGDSLLLYLVIYRIIKYKFNFYYEFLLYLSFVFYIFVNH